MIRNLLVRKGVEPDRLSVSSHGKGNPMVPTPEGVAEPKIIVRFWILTIILALVAISTLKMR